MSPHDTTLLTKQIDLLKIGSDKLNYQVEHFSKWPIASIRLLRHEDAALEAKLESLGFTRDPDVLDTWSLRHCGRTAPWLARADRRNFSTSIPLTR